MEEPYSNKSSFPGAWVINHSNYKLLIYKYTFHLSSIAEIWWGGLADVQITDYNIVRRDFEGERDDVQRENPTVQKQVSMASRPQEINWLIQVFPLAVYIRQP